MAKTNLPFWVSPPAQCYVKGELHFKWTISSSRAARKKHRAEVSIAAADLAKYPRAAQRQYILAKFKEAMEGLGVLPNIVAAAKVAALKGELPAQPPGQLVTATR
jgi:hypothetical protein